MKKTMSIILTTAMCLSMAVSAFATQVQPRTPTCPDCGSGTIKYNVPKPFGNPSRCDICGKLGIGTYYGYRYVCSADCGYEESFVGQFICNNCR